MPGNLDGVGVARVGADRADEISFDAPVALRRRDGLVAGLDAVVGLRDLLAQRVVRHQGFDDRGDGETADGEFLHAVHEVAAADFAVNEQIVELDGLARQFGFGRFHGGLLVEREYHGAASLWPLCGEHTGIAGGPRFDIVSKSAWSTVKTLTVFPPGEVDERGIGEVHRPVPITRHQRVDLRQFGMPRRFPFPGGRRQRGETVRLRQRRRS